MSIEPETPQDLLRNKYRPSTEDAAELKRLFGSYPPSGVSWNNTRRRWVARFCKDSAGWTKNAHRCVLGHYNTYNEALAAVRAGRRIPFIICYELLRARRVSAEDWDTLKAWLYCQDIEGISWRARDKKWVWKLYGRHKGRFYTLEETLDFRKKVLASM